MDNTFNPNNNYPTYQIGDKVTIRQWDDMEAEFGLNIFGNIAVPHVFNVDMEPLCGKTFTIKNVFRYPTDFDIYVLDGNVFNFSSPMFEQSKPVPPTSPLTLDDLLQGATS